ncbi:MAG: hemerythrin domain-containing protein [Chitinophagaceae bacterium]|nr:hemerythrin domain-containing protein [Chitinophagaceae bacterium]
MVVLLVKKGLKKTVQPERISKFICWFFINSLEAHLQEEESQLFRMLSTASEMLQRLKKEHALLRQMAEKLAQWPADLITINQFAHLLEGHIRYEERIVYNALQSNVAAQLEQLLPMQTAATCVAAAAWPDHFWE